MWENFIINSILTILAGLIKNPQKAASLKDKLLKIRDTINAIYPS